MQAGFAAFEAGMVKENNAAHVALKNLIDWVILSIVFYFVGFGFMFGKSYLGFIGSTDFFLLDMFATEHNSSNIAFFMFQMAFGGTALTIV
jgi:Amt family ammonium transporter